MNKLFLIVLVIFFYSCGNPQKDFNSFDMTYYDGWAERFSFKTDSAGNYYVKSIKLENSNNTGKLPDSILFKINYLVKKIKNKQIRDGIGQSCADCPKLSIWIKVKNEVFTLNQMYYVDDGLYDLINPLSKFIFEGKHKKIDRFIDFKSEFIAPKPLVDPVEFVYPK